jgi:hypothetical protein
LRPKPLRRPDGRQLTGTLFAIASIREDVREIRDLLSEDDDGEDAEEAT